MRFAELCRESISAALSSYECNLTSLVEVCYTQLMLCLILSALWLWLLLEQHRFLQAQDLGHCEYSEVLPLAAADDESDADDFDLDLSSSISVRVGGTSARTRGSTRSEHSGGGLGSSAGDADSDDESSLLLRPVRGEVCAIAR